MIDSCAKRAMLSVPLPTMDTNQVIPLAIRNFRVTAGNVERITRCNIDFDPSRRQHVASQYGR